MEVWILDSSFKTILLIDTFESLLWVERYLGAGNFEIYSPVELNILKQIKKGYYGWLKGSESTMIIDNIQVSTDTESGPKMTFSGRSLEWILHRRIIWNQTILSGSLQDGVKKLLMENAINPEINDRKIENLIFEETDDPAITSLELNAQYTGDDLYDAIYSICETNNIGFKITLNENYQFVFKLYSGKDRSYNQIENPYVIFSSKFENIISSNYIDSDSTLRNVALVAGEDSGTDRKRFIVGSSSGLERRELYVDARDIQSETYEGVIEEDDYYERLKTRGEQKLSEYKSTTSFEGEMETTKTFIYGQDFFKGDIIQFVNEYDMEARVRVMELIRAQDASGYSTYPTFNIIDDKEVSDK